MTRTIAVAERKGGTGKTTTAVNVAGWLALQGMVVLLVDLDPQANATTHLGIEPVLADRPGATRDEGGLFIGRGGAPGMESCPACPLCLARENTPTPGPSPAAQPRRAVAM